jgi:putative DNA primase/helicase
MFFDLGYTPVPAKDKKPLVKDWQLFGRNRPVVHSGDMDDHLRPRNLTKTQCQAWAKHFRGAGINLVCVDGIIWLDIDDDEIARDPRLPKSPMVRIGARGFAAAFRYDGPSEDFVRNGVKIISILGEGKSVAVPPSIHPVTGRPYIWVPEGAPLVPANELPVLDRQLIEQIAVDHGAEHPLLRLARNCNQSTDVAALPEQISAQRGRYDAYARGALRAATDELSRIPEGGRNHELFKAAASLSRFITAELLTSEEVYAALDEACTVNGLLRDDGAYSVHRTISSGIQTGMYRSVEALTEVDPTVIFANHPATLPEGASRTPLPTKTLVALPDGRNVEVTENVAPEDEERPCTRYAEGGLRHYGEKGTIYVGAPMVVLARTEAVDCNQHGRVIAFRTSKGWRTLSIASEELQSTHGDALRERLAQLGYDLSPGTWKLLATYLMREPAPLVVRSVSKPGWNDGYYVQPGDVIGPDGKGPVLVNSDAQPVMGTRGTLEQWRSTIGTVAVGNPLLALAIAASLSGAIRTPLDVANSGLHFYGDSTTGKTTLLRAACSVWGSPAFMCSWRATSNGLEAISESRNDSVLITDEISECSPHEIGAISYMIGNGVGKARARRDGSLREPRIFTLTHLSSGEQDLRSAAGDNALKIGQLLRLVDVPMIESMGAFRNAYGMDPGAFARWISEQSRQCYGTAARAFITYVAETGDAGHEDAERFIVPTGNDIIERIGKQMAIYYAAACVAERSGVVPGGFADTVNQGIILAMSAWVGDNGDDVSVHQKIIDKIESFITANEDKLFTSVNDKDQVRGNYRAGWWTDGPQGRSYFITSIGFDEMTKGFSKRIVFDALIKYNKIITTQRKDGKTHTELKKINGRPVRVTNIKL